MNTAAIIRHNTRVSSPRWRWVPYLLAAWVTGPFAALLAHLFFRFRTESLGLKPSMALPGGELPFGPKAILSIQHYYELDPILTYVATVWPYSLLRPSLFAHSTAGAYWSRNPLTRALAFIAGLLLLVPDAEPEGGALRELSRLLNTRQTLFAVIFPTGPMGKRRRYILQRGVGWLAMECPDVPVIPVTLEGVQDLRLKDVLLLRRPVIRLRSGAPIYGRDLREGSRDERELAVCAEIARRWKELEAG